MHTAACVLLTLAATVCFAAGTSSAGKQQEKIAGMPAQEALRLGERMYRTGILPSGEPLQAVVKGDIPTEGSKFTCAHCHQRSGFGSMEGTYRTAPIHGTQLYSALSKFKRMPMRGRPIESEEVLRPAYTDATLIEVLRTGVDPSGRQLSDVMPIYALSDRDASIMAYYLKNLSTGNEPGVSEEVLRLATVITSEVPKADRDSMLGPLQHFVDNWRISRSMERSVRAEAFIQEGASRDMRKLVLTVWELTGPANTWRKQLDAFYRKEPVFALLGGITTGEWEPIHAFCEENKVPALFPITDYPVLDGNGGYTFYLSKGLYQEGESAARYLHGRADLPKDLSVVQVFRNDQAGRALSRAFGETWTGLGHAAPEQKMLGTGESLPAGFWKGLHKEQGAVIVWLNDADFPPFEDLFGTAGTIISSSSLLGSRMYSVPEKQRASFYFTYPYSLPKESRVYKANVEAALRSNKVPIVKPDIYFRMSPLFSVLSGPLSRMRSYVYRDYLIELLEATPDISITPVAYTRLSFGTGQRYASKGCYIVQLTDGPAPDLIKKSDWIIQ